MQQVTCKKKEKVELIIRYRNLQSRSPLIPPLVSHFFFGGEGCKVAPSSFFFSLSPEDSTVYCIICLLLDCMHIRCMFFYLETLVRCCPDYLLPSLTAIFYSNPPSKLFLQVELVLIFCLFCFFLRRRRRRRLYKMFLHVVLRRKRIKTGGWREITNTFSFHINSIS